MLIAQIKSSEITDPPENRADTPVMPWGLKHFQQTRQLHFLTFSCYHRQPKLRTPASRLTFELALEQVRQKYGLCVYGYVVMRNMSTCLSTNRSVERWRKRCNR